MRIQHNIMALNSHRQLGNNNSAVSKSLEKLSSGYRINRAGDDAAGLAISEKMRAQIKGLTAASDNSQDAISLVQTAEGGLQEVHSMLNRMMELATKSANGTYTDDVDRRALQDEVSALKDEINRIADSTNFNGINLLDGTLDNAVTATAGVGASGVDWKVSLGAGAASIANGIKIEAKAASAANTIKATFAAGGTLTITLGAAAKSTYSANDVAAAVRDAAKAAVADGTLTSAQGEAYSTFSLEGDNVTLAADSTGTPASYSAAVAGASAMKLQIGDTNDAFNQLTLAVSDMHAAGLGINAIDISTRDGASDAIANIKTAINTVSTQRGKLGAIQNRLEHTINNLGVTTENITAAESRIRDVDMAKEMMEFTKNSVLMQSAQAMLAQANQQPQSILQLLQ